jgi:alanyl-tRNA synthetase
MRVTTRLYYHDSLLTEFDAAVTDRRDDGRRIYLDQSAFYPTSGGQPHDLGSLDGIAVLDVVDEDDRVAHLLAEPLPERAQRVAGRIDRARRIHHMQQHTGQHLLSALCSDLHGYHTVSVHFGDQMSTIDVTASAIPATELRALERRANELIFENRAVRVSFEEASTVQGLRKPSDRTGELRVVTIDGIDRSACGGTHVRATGEIGGMLLRRVEKAKGAMRIEFICGLRAIERARADFTALTQIGQMLTASLDEAPSIVEARMRERGELESRLKRSENELAVFRARALYDTATADAGGVRRLVQHVPSGSVDVFRPMALAFAALPRAVFVGSSDDPPSILLAASADSGVEAGRVLKDALQAHGGRGGGSPRLAQGSVPDAGALRAVLAAVGAS